MGYKTESNKLIDRDNGMVVTRKGWRMKKVKGVKYKVTEGG